LGIFISCKITTCEGLMRICSLVEALVLLRAQHTTISARCLSHRGRWAALPETGEMGACKPFLGQTPAVGLSDVTHHNTVLPRTLRYLSRVWPYTLDT